MKTASGKALNKNYSFSFTIAQAKYDNSNIKEYAIQLFRSQFGMTYVHLLLQRSMRLTPMDVSAIIGLLLHIWISIL